MTLIFRKTLLLAAIALTSSACTIRVGPIEDDGGWDNTGAQVASSSSTTGTGGARGTGGTGASASGGGWGGAGTCIGEFDGVGETAAACESIALAPATSGTCDGHAPLGYLACERAFDLYAPGHAENLVACMRDIPAAAACDDNPVVQCVGKMYGDACTNDYIAGACDTWGSLCDGNGESFDVAGCATDLNPFSDAGLTELVDCMNVNTGNCQDRYDSCLDTVLTLGS